MICIPAGFSVHGDLQGRFSKGIFPTQGSNPHVMPYKDNLLQRRRPRYLGRKFYGGIITISECCKCYHKREILCLVFSSVLVRILQRKGTDGIYRENKIYYKNWLVLWWKLISHKSAGWVSKLKSWYSSGLKARSLETQEEWMLQSESESRRELAVAMQRQTGMRKSLLLGSGSVFSF